MSFFPEPGLVLFLQPRLLSSLYQSEKPDTPDKPEDANAAQDADKPELVEAEDELASHSLLETLGALEELDGAEGTEAAAFVMVRNIKSLSFCPRLA